jgi:chromosomal replication initiator protein
MFLIDDIHFLSNKQSTQEEFLHTFNALYELSKKIILASDAHPKMIAQLKENLASRFMSGMVIRIDKPEYATRLLILRSKAAKFDVYFPEDVLEFIAEKFNDNVREVESALITLSAHAKFNEKKIDLQLANEVLSEFFCNEGKIIKINEIEESVLAYFNISRADLHSNKKTKSIAFPRQVCMYLIKTLLDWSYQQIGNYFSSKKHSTVMFAIKKVSEQIENDKQFKLSIEKLMERIKKEKR